MINNLDPGYTATGSCASTITYINGEKGELRYRGYDIVVKKLISYLLTKLLKLNFLYKI